MPLKYLFKSPRIYRGKSQTDTRYKFAEISKIYSQTVEIENKDKKMVNAIRFTILLKRSKNFNQLVGDSLK